MSICQWPTCRYETPEGKIYCFLHGRNAPKEAKPGPKPIAKKSDKRKVEDKELAKITKQMLEESDKCEMNLPRCTAKAIELHHMKKRSPATITDKRYLKRSCLSCNSYAEQFPLQAIDLGASFSKFS